MSPDEVTIARLALVKYLFGTAVEQSHAAPPLSGLAVLTLHDAVEMFLQIASEHLGCGANQPAFLDYWDLLSRKLGTELSQREPMRRLNKARVAVKHHGTLPSQLDIEAFRASTVNFFSDNCPTIFGLELESISLVDLVNPMHVREKLKVAQRMASEGDTLTALDEIAIAFAEIMLDYDERHIGMHGESLLRFGGHRSPRITLNLGGPSDRTHPLERDLKGFMDDTESSLNALGKAIKIVALGLDYARYARFLQATPHVSRGMTGQYFADRKHTVSDPPTMASVQAAIDYVVEASLQVSRLP